MRFTLLPQKGIFFSKMGPRCLLKQMLSVMKLTVFLTFIALTQLRAEGVSQSITISAHNISLEKIFREVQKQTGFNFLCIKEQLADTHTLDLQVKDLPLKDVLAMSFKDQPLTYTIINKTIIVSRRETPDDRIRFLPPPLIHITGAVIDSATGSPLVGVTIQVQGNVTGTVTDANGRFNLDLPGKSILVISYLGYQKKEIAVNGRTDFTISLALASQGLNQLVVVGYGTQKKSDVTGAISTVNVGSILGHRPVSTLSTLMQNVVPGLNVTIPSGQPGASSTLNIRGATTLNTTGKSIVSGEPLVLVDNVPFNGPLNMIDPNNIATLTVLKDAGSAAIYGGRSAFGVILITTKHGLKDQKPQFSFSSQLTLASATNLPDVASPEQFLQSLTDMGTETFWSGQNVALWRHLYDSIKNNPDQMPASGVIYQGKGYPVRRTNPIKDLLGSTVPQTQNSFAVSGGGEKTTYRFSFGNTHEKGIMAPKANLDYFKRYNLASSFSIDLTKWLTTQIDGSYYNQTASQSSDQGFDYYVAATYPSLLPVSDSLVGNNGVKGINGSPKNVTTLSGAQVTKNSDVRFTGRAILTPLKGLTITGDYTYDNLQNNFTSYNRLISVVNAMNFNVSNFGKGTYKLSNQTTLYKSVNLFANYNKSLGHHHANFMIGYNQEENITSGNSVSRNAMINATQPSISNATGPLSADDNYASYALKGYFYRINYDYDGKYLVQINGRYDGTSNFSPGHRFGFFPSGALGWRISNERFMEGLQPVLSNLKLRVSYGSVGNQNISPYSYVPIMSSITPGWLNGTSAYLTSFSTPGLISTNFTWEKVKTIDMGVDFGLFSDHLTGSFDLYQRDTRDILALGATPLPAALGTSAPLENSASLRSKGYDIELTYSNNIGKNIHFRVSANLSDNIAYVTKFDGNPNKLLSTYYVGQKIGEIWGYTSDGFYGVDDFEKGSLAANLTGGTLLPNRPRFQGENPNPGDVRFKDWNGDGIVYNGINTKDSAGDFNTIGNSSRRYLFGVNGSVSFKNITFSFALSGVGKQDLAMANTLILPAYNAYSTIYAHQTNYWTPANTDSYFGRLYDHGAGNQKFNQMMPQTKYLQNGAYLRVNNLTLDYAIPEVLLKRVNISGFHIFCSLENPFLFDHLPDGIESGLDSQSEGMQYPYLKKTSFGINLTF